MKIYWFIKSIPEYHGIDPALIKKTWMPCYWKTYRHWQQWLMMALTLGATGYLLTHANELFNPPQIVGFVLVCTFWLAWNQLSISLDRPYIRDALRDEGRT